MNPPTARFCMNCGRRLVDEREERGVHREQEGPGDGGGGFRLAGMSAFTISILGSLILSVILMTVFGLPVFIMAAFLPLLWFSRNN